MLEHLALTERIIGFAINAHKLGKLPVVVISGVDKHIITLS
jgi:hypothetical protein